MNIQGLLFHHYGHVEVDVLDKRDLMYSSFEEVRHIHKQFEKFGYIRHKNEFEFAVN